jgi:hypothetical protein
MAYAYFDSGYAPTGFLIVPNGGDPYDDATTTLVQTDWDFPGVAQAMGWSLSSVPSKGKPGCMHDSTDGTVDCPCGVKAGEFISAAYDYIREHNDEEFPGLDEYLPSSLLGHELVENHHRKASMKMNASIVDTLAKTARILCEDEQVNSDTTLQAMVGDPADTRVSTFVQFQPNPGSMQLPNPLSPVEGDEIFFTYMIPGAAFQSHDGQEWTILFYGSNDDIEIENRWYPRNSPHVSLWDIRRSIHQWIEPVTQVVPPPPPGVDYSAQLVRMADKTGVGHADELTDYKKTDLTGGW